MAKTSISSTKRLLHLLNPASPIKRVLLFVVLFAVIGGGYMAYKSFAATPTVYKVCYGTNHVIIAENTAYSPGQKYSIVFVDSWYEKGKENPAYVAAEGYANSKGGFTVTPFVSGNQGGKFYVYKEAYGKFSLKYTVPGGECVAG